MRKRSADTLPPHVVLVASLVVLIAYTLAKGLLWALNWPKVRDLVMLADHAIYMNQAHRILSGGPLYNPWQLAGPYDLSRLPELYPPITVYGLIIPMSLLPDIVWWVVPIGVLVAVIVRWHPRGWAWVLLLSCFLVPRTWTSIAAGNPAIWSAMAVALGTVWKWPAAFAVLKPTLAPFAFIGIRSRAWWAAVAGMAAVSVLMLPAWGEYVQILRNDRDGSLFYGLVNAPLLVMPIVAWLGARDRPLPAELVDRLGAWVEPVLFGAPALAVAIFMWGVQ